MDLPRRLLELGHSMGNQAMGQMLRRESAVARAQVGTGGVATTSSTSQRADAEEAAARTLATRVNDLAAVPMDGPPVSRPWLAGGTPIPDNERAVLEPAMRADLANVRVFDGRSGSLVAARHNARAVTFGPHVFLGAGERSTDRGLMAHEAAHVVQQASPGASPHPAGLGIGKPSGEFDFERKLRRIDSLLSYNLIDWAVTDAEATEALELLETLGHVERVTAMSHINVGRLRENLPSGFAARLDVLVSETRPEVARTGRIHDLLSYRLLDWVITDAEAREALKLLEGMPPEQRMHTLMGIDRRRLYENLPDEDLKDRLTALWSEAHTAWARARQQHDPLGPGDRVRVRVWNALGQEEERLFAFHPFYVVANDESLDLPMVGKVNVRGLRPSHIEARLSELLQNDILVAPIVSVEVVRRRGEAFEARDLPRTEDAPPADTRLEPGDTFELRVLETSTWTEESDISGNFQVDARGRVNLRHFGLVDVIGLSAAALEAKIQVLLKDWYKQPPTIWIWFTSHRGRAYVAPAAARPRPLHRSADLAAERERERALVPTRREIDVYLEFVRAKQGELLDAKTKPRDRTAGYEALTRFFAWLDANRDDAKLAATSPWEVWARIYTPIWIAAIRNETRSEVLRKSEEEREKKRSAEVEAKLDVYWTWAMARWREAGVQFRSLGRAYLLTEHPLRQAGMDALTNAVLSWAHANTADPDFLKRSPDEVAEFLAAKDPHLGAAVELARTAPPRVEYFPEMDRTRYTMGELATETIIGFIPIIGDATDALSALTGVSATGHELDTGDRVLAGICALIPFVPSSALRGGRKLPEVVERVAVTTGRSSDEIYAIFRVAGHLDATDVKDLERIIAAVNDGKRLPSADLQVLDNIALKLKGPLEEAASLLAKGKAIPIGQLRADIVTGTRFIPGQVEHKAQRWIEYQFRHPDRFPRITGEVDPTWSRLYDGIIANKHAGGAFEKEVLARLGHEKNTAVMIPEVGGKVPGFIPDRVKGDPAELVWGQAYHFTEVKGWKEMSDTGNLSAMIDYVSTYGGHLEVVFKSSKHADGATRLTKPLQDRLDRLIEAGKASIVRHP